MSNLSPTLVIVEDEENIRRFVRLSLEQEGYQVHEAETIQRGLIEACTRKPDMVVLDLGLPDGDGCDFIRQIRSWSSIPILVLSARSSETDKVAALDAGADDYLTKPFGASELLARVRAHLRRSAKAERPEKSIFKFGALTVDLVKRQVRRNGEEVHLTPIEYRLLSYLVANPDVVVTHQQLLRNVWGPNHVEDSHYVRIYMGQLRKKLEIDPSLPEHILTEIGVGYRFVPE